MTLLQDRLLTALLVCSLGLGSWAIAVPAHAEPDARIAILEDGPFGRSYPVQQIMRELRALLQDEFAVEFPQARQTQGNWTVESIDRALDVLLAAQDVDLLITLGPIGTDRVSRRTELTKPVIAPFAFDPALQGLPSQDSATGVRNLNYLVIFPALGDATRRLRELSGATRVGVLVFQPILDAIPALREEIAGVGGAEGMELVAVPAGSTADDVLAALPENLEAVVIAGLVHLDREQLALLATGLKVRRVPSLVLLGRDATELGFLASLTPESDWVRIARRVALNAQRALLGEDPGRFSTRFPLRPQLSVNLDTARAIGVSPTFEVLSDARLVGQRREPGERTLDLRGAVVAALESNPELSASERALSAASEDIAVARARLMPHLDLSGQAVQLDDETGTVRLGILPERVYAGTASLTQVLYDERAWAGLGVSRSQQEAREQEHAARRLDLVRDVSVAYFQILRARTLEGVREDDLEVTRSNLELARVRRSVGAAGPSDVLRWESKLAQDQSALINARRDARLASMELNRLLDRRPEEPLRVDESSTSGGAPVLTDPRIRDLIDRPLRFSVLRDYLVQVALRRGPELRGLDAQIKAQQRRADSVRRSFWQPSIAAQAEMSKADLERNTPPPSLPELSEDRQNYVLGLQVSLPLFEGGGRFAEMRRAGEQMAALRLQRRAAAKQLEHNTRAAALVAGASYTRIGLARDSARAAQENLSVVTEGYAQGAVSIATILDAQNAAVEARARTAASEYEHLVDLMNLQRALGWFAFLGDDEEREAFVRGAIRFVAGQGAIDAP